MWTMLGAKNTVNTDGFGAWEAENHGIYDVFFASGSKKPGIYNVFLPRAEQNAGIYAGCSMLHDVVSTCGKRKNTVFYSVFASRARKKDVKKRSKTDILASRSGQSNPA